MIIALLIANAAVGCLLGRLYSYLALLAVSPLMGLVVALVAWTSAFSGWRAALVGLLAMALSQAGFLVGIALDPRAGFREATRKRGPAKQHPVASKR